MTIGQAKELASMFGQNTTVPQQHGAVGKKCIIRTYASGVHFGTPVSISENGGRSRCELSNSRRIWKWKGGLSLHEVSQKGIDQSGSRISCTSPQSFIEDAIEFIPCSEAAIKLIEGAQDDDC